MKPLGFLTYFKGNKKKSISLIFTIAFSILLIGSFQMILDNISESAVVYTEKYKHLSVIFNQKETIDIEIMNEVKIHESVEKVIPVERVYVQMQMLGIATMTHHYKMSKEDAIYYLNYLDIDYDVSLLPDENSNQIVFSHNILKNNGYKIGDKPIAQNNIVTISDSFESSYLTGVIPTTLSDLTQAYIIIPKSGQIHEMNTFLNAFNQNNYTVDSYDNMSYIIDGVLGDIDTLFEIITLIVIVTIGLGLGISAYVHYYQRRKEIALIHVLGFCKQKILLRTSKEIIWLMCIAFFIGISLIYVEQLLLNHMLLEPKGLPTALLSIDILMRIVLMPLIIGLFSLIPIWIMLTQIDGIKIIEGAI